MDNDTDVSINFPNVHTKRPRKASVTIDLGLKDIYLKADITADPDFERLHKAYSLLSLTKTITIDLDAKYGEKLFDIAGLCDLVGLEAPENENTMYYVEYKFFDNSDEPGDPAR